MAATGRLRLTVALLRTLALGALLFLALACAQPAEHGEARGEPPPPPSRTTSPPPTPPAAPDGYLAVAVARHSVEVTAELDGALRTLDVAVGDRVEPGTRIATIETREVAEQLASAKAALTALEAEHKRSTIERESVKDQYDRRAAYKELYPREELEELLAKEKAATAAVETAAARVAEERGHVAQLQGRLSHAVLSSPLRGTVAARYLDRGAIVRPGTPIVRLISAGSYVVRFAVPPEQTSRLHLGEPIDFRSTTAPGSPVLPGTISQIAPQVDTASQMVFAEAELQLPAELSSQLQDGLVGTVRVGTANPSGQAR
jgi:RND family efflux transporter MFP subunit